MRGPLGWIGAVPHVVITVLMVVVIVDMLVGVFLRYVVTWISATFDLPTVRFFWVEEVGEWSLAWLTFIGAAGAAARRALIVVDTVGELASMYSVGVVAFVGGSLVPAGGHNVLEPALRGKPVLFGPHTENFRESSGLLRAGGGGLVVRDGAGLVTTLTRLMTDRDLCAALGAASRQAAASREGAARETLELIRRFLLPSVAS